ncbi:rubredoxin-like superfamily protein [Actinidia rufa]|uniref:Rubredoxin-like superfamily protein n=1 Tax=Actinidia rufa TaxID=165716 RepID=A0A7J0GAY3_9ERIC|nr:rubredoxin-like superfamily protein [Actinidia rufa]
MWRKLSSLLRTLAPRRSGSKLNSIAAGKVSSSTSPHRKITAIFSRHFASDSDNVVSKKRVEDVMPIATGHEREELEAELQGRKVLDIDNPEGPFGTKLEVVGPGGPPDGHGDDEHH